MFKKDELKVEEEKASPPVFLSELQDIEVVEGQAAHFDTRVLPLESRIEWYFNGKPLVTGSR